MLDAVLEVLPSEFHRFNEAVNSLSKMLLQRHLFPPMYPSVEKMLGEAFIRLDLLLQKKKSVTFKVIGNSICYLNFQVKLTDTDDKALLFLRQTLGKLSIGEIECFNGTSKDELAALADILDAASKKGETNDLSQAWSRIKHIRIRCGSVFDRVKNELVSPVHTETAAGNTCANLPSSGSKMGRIVDKIVRNLEKLHSSESKLAGNKILEIVEKEGGHASTVLLLSSLRSYDDYTFSHSVNVAVISAAVAKRLGFQEQEIDEIGLGALLHDIGKLYVPQRVLHKMGRLTPNEWMLIKRHPVDGERILREEGIIALARRIAFEHHMRYDGKGYPVPRQNYRPVPASHIVRVADSYDALTTKRPYRRQISPYRAVKMMERGRGSEFHPHYLDVFLHVLGNIPIGSIVKLASGENVLVVDINSEHGNLPRVRVLTDADGNQVERDVILDLNEKDPGTHQYRWTIADIVEQPFRDVDIGKYLMGTK